MESPKQIQISFAEMQQALFTLFRKYAFSEDQAQVLANIHSESTLDGVNSHGINRVPLFIEYVKKGLIKIDAEALKVTSFGSIERWDGHFASGVLNATKCLDRSVTLAKENGMGLVALRNTNHWMRGGTYGWQAAEKGCISILFTNTQPNMPPWGGKESRIGNNPFIVAIPRAEGHVVLDMAISQYSFGKIHDFKLKGKKLPFPGGWDENDMLSNNPEKILGKERGLPIGYWKGSALSMVLDMLATLLSAGNSTYRTSLKTYETGVSQIFLSVYPQLFQDSDFQQKLLNEIINYTHNVEPMHDGDRIYYPGERTLLTRAANLKEGMPISVEVWKKVLALSS